MSSFSQKQDISEFDFDDEDDMAASCLLSLIEAAKSNQQAQRQRTDSCLESWMKNESTTQRAAVVAPASAPAGVCILILISVLKVILAQT